MKYDQELEMIERNILEEKPYNGWKHFLFSLPEMFGFLIKLGILYGLSFIFVEAFSITLIEKLPEFCQLLQ